MTQFLLKIDIGNSAVKSGYNVSNLLLGVANKIQYEHDITGAGGNIHDINGNAIGTWKVSGRGKIIEVD